MTPDSEIVRYKTEKGYWSSIDGGSGTVKLNNIFYGHDEDSLLEDMDETKASEMFLIIKA